MWIPSFSLAVVLAGALVGVRLIVAPHGAIEVGAICVAALLAYWVAYAVLWLEPGERLLVRDLRRTLTSPFRTA